MQARERLPVAVGCACASSQSVSWFHWFVFSVGSGSSCSPGSSLPAQSGQEECGSGQSRPPQAEHGQGARGRSHVSASVMSYSNACSYRLIGSLGWWELIMPVCVAYVQNDGFKPHRLAGNVEQPLAAAFPHSVKVRGLRFLPCVQLLVINGVFPAIAHS